MVGTSGMFEAIYLLLNDIQNTYVIQAPPGTDPYDAPYFVIYPIGGEPAYCFSAVMRQPDIQISQFYPWTGSADTGLADNVLIVTALDKQDLTDDGIIIYRLMEPLIMVTYNNPSRPVLSIVQRWRFQYME